MLSGGGTRSGGPTADLLDDSMPAKDGRPCGFLVGSQSLRPDQTAEAATAFSIVPTHTSVGRTYLEPGAFLRWTRYAMTRKPSGLPSRSRPAARVDALVAAGPGESRKPAADVRRSRLAQTTRLSLFLARDAHRAGRRALRQSGRQRASDLVELRDSLD